VTNPRITRTEWAERQVEELLSVPLISEFVFRSPRHNDPTEKEVIDHLIIHKQQGILISQKTQDDPEKRTIDRNELWVLKNIRGAVKQTCGAIRNPKDLPKWCEHPRRGTVDLGTLPRIVSAFSRRLSQRSAASRLPLSTGLDLHSQGRTARPCLSRDRIELDSIEEFVPGVVTVITVRSSPSPSADGKGV